MGRKGSAAPPHKKPRAKSPVQYFVKVKYNDNLYPTLDKHKKVLDFLDWIKTEGPRELAEVRVSDLKFFTSESGKRRRLCQWQEILAEIEEGGTRAQPWYVDYDEPPEVPGPSDARDIIEQALSLDHCTVPPDNKPPLVYVEIAGTVRECRNAVGAGIIGTERVPPAVLSGCMRSGKTSALRHIFEDLKESGYSPIYISFNGESKTIPGRDEPAVNALCRAVALALMKEKPESKAQADAWRCDPKLLLGFLKKQSDAKKRVVLLVDELNVLLKPQEEIAGQFDELACFLREHVLDVEGRFLVFSTHVPLTAGIQVLLARRTPTSMRMFTAVKLPVANTLNELRGMSNDCEDLTPCEAAYYSHIPALIHTIKSEQPFDLQQRFDAERAGVESTTALPREFIDEFLSGEYDSSHTALRRFDGLTWMPSTGNLRWVLGYAGKFCRWVGLKQAHKLVEELVVHANTVDRGIEWEVISQLALFLRCEHVRHGKVHSLLKIQDCDMEDTPPNVRHRVIPALHRDPKAAMDWWARERKQYPCLAVLRPQHAGFEDFDTMLIYNPYDHSVPVVVGFQNKLGKGYPEKDAPEGTLGVLLRGDAPALTTGPRKFRRWEYLDKETIMDFLGKSLEHMYPADWLAWPAPAGVGA